MTLFPVQSTARNTTIHTNQIGQTQKICQDLQEIDLSQVFKDMGPVSWDPSKLKNAPKDHQKIKVHFVFAVKHDGWHKARLVAHGLSPENQLKQSTQELFHSGV